MKIGFTGTRFGMTDAQRASLGVFVLFDCEPTEFHHGACKGSDSQAASLIRYIHEKSVKVVAHPGPSSSGTDNEWLDKDSLADADEVRQTKTHFARNRDIVNECDLLIATPREMTHQSRVGTWYTIDYATKVGKPVHVIFPDGSLLEYPIIKAKEPYQ